MNTFLFDWQRFYPASIPISHTLKISESDRWVRFHSLPESQRYVTTDEEMDIVLHRHNVLAEAVLGEGGPCWLSVCWYSWEGSVIDLDEVSAACGGTTMAWGQAFPDPEDDDLTCNIFAGGSTWRAGHFDSVLRDIARSNGTVMFVSKQTGAVFAPYDGGVDIVLPTVAEVRQLILAHFDWLSPNESGY